MGENMDGKNGNSKKSAEIIRLANFQKAGANGHSENNPPAAQTTPNKETYLPSPNNIVPLTLEAQVVNIKQELARVRDRVKEDMRNAPLAELKVLAHEFALDAQYALDEARLISPLSTHKNSETLLSNLKRILNGAVGKLGGNFVPEKINPDYYYRRIAQQSVTNIELAVIHFLDQEIAFKTEEK